MIAVFSSYFTGLGADVVIRLMHETNTLRIEQLAGGEEGCEEKPVTLVEFSVANKPEIKLVGFTSTLKSAHLEFCWQ